MARTPERRGTRAASHRQHALRVCSIVICVGFLLAAAAPVAADCFDTTRNGDETDVDCGGSCATKCAVSKSCIKYTDCASQFCAAGQCIQGDICGMTTWSAWSDCPVSCGGSVATRTRSRLYPSASGCTASTSDSQGCNTNLCAVPNAASEPYVGMSLLLHGLAAVDFSYAQRDQFRRAVASVTGQSQSQVLLQEVRDVSSRRLGASGRALGTVTWVDFRVTVPKTAAKSPGTVESLLQRGGDMTVLESALSQEGLAISVDVSSAAVAVADPATKFGGTTGGGGSTTTSTDTGPSGWDKFTQFLSENPTIHALLWVALAFIVIGVGVCAWQLAKVAKRRAERNMVQRLAERRQHEEAAKITPITAGSKHRRQGSKRRSLDDVAPPPVESKSHPEPVKERSGHRKRGSVTAAPTSIVPTEPPSKPKDKDAASTKPKAGRDKPKESSKPRPKPSDAAAAAPAPASASAPAPASASAPAPAPAPALAPAAAPGPAPGPAAPVPAPAPAPAPAAETFLPLSTIIGQPSPIGARKMLDPVSLVPGVVAAEESDSPDSSVADTHAPPSDDSVPADLASTADDDEMADALAAMMSSFLPNEALDEAAHDDEGSDAESPVAAPPPAAAAAPPPPMVFQVPPELGASEREPLANKPGKRSNLVMSSGAPAELPTAFEAPDASDAMMATPMATALTHKPPKRSMPSRSSSVPEAGDQPAGSSRSVLSDSQLSKAAGAPR